MATDISLSSAEQLLVLINTENSTTIPLEKITFNTPTVLQDDPDSKNSSVLVSAIPDSGYNGNVTVKYSRNSLALLQAYNGGDPIELILEEGDGLEEALVEFNGLYGTNLQAGVDIDSSITFPTVDYTEQNYVLTALPGSLAYSGTLTITVSLLVLPLTTFITNTSLNGLELPTILLGQTITFDNPGSQDFGTTPTLEATSTSGLDVSLSSLSPLVCTINGSGVLSFLQPGTCTIEATQDGNEIYLPANSVEQTFNVNAVVPGNPTLGDMSSDFESITIEFTPPAFNGGSAITNYRATTSPGSVVGNSLTSPITVTGLLPNTEYTITLVAQNGVGNSTGSVSEPIFTAYDTLDLAEAFSETDLLGFSYGYAGTSSIPVGAQYTYGLDFSPYGTLLQSTAQGTVISGASNPLSTDIIAMLNYVDLDGAFKTAWKSTASVGGSNLVFNVNGATVAYNGLNDNTRPTDQSFKYVMELTLRNDQTSPRGPLYFTYNLPIDPLVVTNPNNA